MPRTTVSVALTLEERAYVEGLRKAGQATEKTTKEITGHFDKMSSGIGGIFQKFGNLGQSIGVPFSGALGKVGDKLDEAKSKGTSTFSTLQSIGSATFLGLGAGAIAVGAAALKWADDEEQAQARLKTAIKATGDTWGQHSKQVDAVQKHYENLGFTHAQTDDVLATLTQDTNSTTKATENAGLVADIAAARHIDLKSAAQIVGVAVEGNTTRLKKYLPDLNLTAGSAKAVAAAHDQLKKAQEKQAQVQEQVRTGHLKGAAAAQAIQKANEGVWDATIKVNKAQDAGKQAIDALTQRYGGNAAAQAKTFHGEIQVMTAKMQDLGAKIGMILIPIITRLASVFLGVFNFFASHKDIVIALGIAFAVVLAPALYAAAAGAAVAAFNFILMAAPIIAIIAGITLLVLGIMYLVHHWSQVWNKIKEITGDVINAVVNFFKSLPGKIVGALSALGSMVGGAISAAWSWITGQLPGYVVDFLEWFAKLVPQIIIKLGSLELKMYAWIGQEIISLVSKLPGLLASFFSWFAGVVPKIIVAIGNLEIKLAKWVADAFVSLAKKLPGFAADTLKFFGGLVLKIMVAAGNLEIKILKWVGDAFISLVKALPGFAAGVFSWYGRLVTTIISRAGDLAGAMLRWVSGAFDWVWRHLDNSFHNILNWFTNLPGNIGNAMGSLGDIISGAFSGAFNGIKDAWNSTVGNFGFTTPGWLDVIGLGNKSFHIPRMATGGIVTRPTLALIGEAGPEAVVPLSGGGGGGLGGITVNIYAAPFTRVDDSTARMVVDHIVHYQRRNGTSWQTRK